MAYEKFKRGDLIFNNSTRAYAIYDGTEFIKDDYLHSKNYTLAVCFIPRKYQKAKDGSWDYAEFFEVSTKRRRCTTSIDTDHEDFWWKIATEEQKKVLLEAMKKNGYLWIEDTKTIVNSASGEVVRVLKDLVLETKYNQEQILITPTEKKRILLSAIKPTKGYTNYPYSSCYEEYYH